MSAVGGVGAGVGGGAGGLVQLPQLQHAAAVAAANHLYEYQAAAQGAAQAYQQQQYAAAGFDPYATAAGAFDGECLSINYKPRLVQHNINAFRYRRVEFWTAFSQF